MEFLSNLFKSDFMPHGHCYFWQRDILLLNVVSDVVIALAYYSIPIALIYFVKKKKNLAFNWMFVMFATFIFLCGSTHLMDVWTVWNGTYRLQGVVKLLTAVISLVTAVVLWPLVPKALAIPSTGDLEDEMKKRKHAQDELERAHGQLEERVRQRTVELERSSEQLMEKTDKLERFYNVTVNRELEMIALKREIDSLLQQANRPPKYFGGNGRGNGQSAGTHPNA